MLQCMLRQDAGCGYGAQEFISEGPESPNIWLARAGNRNDSAGKKGGHPSGPPFFIAGPSAGLEGYFAFGLSILQFGTHFCMQ